MTDFLLELLSEEIPARMQAKACADLERLFTAEIAKAGLVATALESYATPRRLALIARGLPAATDPVSEETKGPRASAPAQALDGFLRKTGLTRDQLTERDGVLFAIVEQPGRATADVLAAAIPAIVRGFPWPKSMRWGEASTSTSSLRWVRPLKGIVALLGDDVVPFEIDGLSSGAATVGHRFHHPGIVKIGNADDYAAKLRACHVILDPAERQQIIRDGATAAAAAQGLNVVPDEGLVAENAGLTEWPVPLLGAFDPAFLDVPREVIQLTMRTNQKYFACTDAAGALAPNFICTANIEAADGGAGIVAGNAKVLAARLSDAKFFWEQDLKVSLAEQTKKLGQIVFHEKLGTVADKVDRVAKLARWLVEEGIINPSPRPRGEGPLRAAQQGEGESPTPTSPPASPDSPSPNPLPQGGEGFDRATLADMAEQAARLCKADLVTAMVGEFPELQGVMGGYYARAEGLPDAVADAIRDHYKPVGQGDAVPTAPVTVAVSLADKLDTLVAFFSTAQLPSGSRDPFALRRAAIGLLRIFLENDLRFNIRLAVSVACIHLAGSLFKTAYSEERHEVLLNEQRDFFGKDRKTLTFEEETALLVRSTPSAQAMLPLALAVPLIHAFFADRLKVQQKEAGVRHDLIDAVFALGGEDDLVRLLARVHALQAFVATDDGANLLAGYKRAANILRIEEKKDANPSPRSRGEGPTRAARQGEGESGETAASHDAAPDSPSPNPLPASGERALRFPTPPPVGYTPLAPEAALTAALDAAEPAAAQAVAQEEFARAMTALSTLRAPIDAFFEGVTVNDPDPAIRAHRLALLARIRDAVHRVADFSKIEG